MGTFKDKDGRDWRVEITVGAIKRVRNVLQVDIYKLIDNNFALLGELMADVEKLVDVVFALCESQAKEASVVATQFGESLDGSAIGRMSDAFVEAFVDFFRGRREVAALPAILTKSKAVATKISEQATAEVEALDVDSLVENLKKKSGSPPASLE